MKKPILDFPDYAWGYRDPSNKNSDFHEKVYIFRSFAWSIEKLKIVKCDMFVNALY